jgi:predicted phosphodiesterase
MSKHHTPPRWVRWTLASVAAVLACLAFGISTATAYLSLGPHEAVYTVTNDGFVVADLGPLGTLEIDSPLPLGLGARVVVKEIPADLAALDEADTLDALAGDLQGYLQFFSSPQQTIGTVAQALVLDALRRSALAALLVVAAGLGVWAVLGAARRRELVAVLAPRTWTITGGVAVVALITATVTASGVAPPTGGRPASTVFAGTALEGARITGRLAGVIDTYGGQLVGLYRQNEEFYAGARDNLGAAWDEWEQRDQQARAEASATEAPGPDERPAAGTPSPTATPTPTPADDELVSMLIVSDLHCNMGMTPLIGDVAERAGVSLVLNAGDTTLNGTAVEGACVDSFASAVPSGASMVVASGNHDSDVTAAQERAQGQTVLEGQVVEVAGIRILGDRDALETRVGAGTAAVEQLLTPEEQAEELARVACEDGDVDLLLIHTPSVGLPALESGCVPLQVSGHAHQRSGPEQVGLGLRYVNASTAGAAPSQPTVGPLRGTAELTVLRFDAETGRFVDWQLVEVRPDGTATVGDRRQVPSITPPQELPPAEVPPAEVPAQEPAGDAP